MKETFVCVDRQEATALITLGRAPEQNTLSMAMIEELSDVFAGLQNDREVRVVLLTGEGEVFSIGPDIDEIRALTPEQAGRLAYAGQTLTSLIENFGKPVIAAINGPAHGSGCELALACTLRIASPQATFALPGASLGLVPGFGGTSRLSHIIGKARALEMMLTGGPICAEEALRIGLVNRVAIEMEQLLPICKELARQISRNAPLAIRYALEAVNHGSQMSLVDGLRLESALFGLCFATEDVQEGTKAFWEKRLPIFKGR